MNKKIFIIEDDANLLYSLQAKFRVEGFSVIADNGSSEKEILGKITNLKPDFIILDLILPEIDGFNLLRNIKTDSNISSIPVFIFTNLSDADSRQRCLNLGAEYYWVKTDFSIDDFVAKVKKIIANRGR